MDRLVRFWQKCRLKSLPYVHPDDEGPLRKRFPTAFDKWYDSTASYVASPDFGNFSKEEPHLSLIPGPYAGDLHKSHICILMLNPGFHLMDYYADWDHAAFRRDRIRTLRQDLRRSEFPFVFLNPEYCWHGGYKYFEDRLRKLAVIVANKRFGGSYWKALRALSQSIAVIELFPYHSKSFGAGNLAKSLPSCLEAKFFVQNRLRRMSQERRDTLIVTRGMRHWEIPVGGPNTVIFAGAETRAARMEPKSNAGKAILRALGIRESD